MWCQVPLHCLLHKVFVFVLTVPLNETNFEVNIPGKKYNKMSSSAMCKADVHRIITCTIVSLKTKTNYCCVSHYPVTFGQIPGKT